MTKSKSSGKKRSSSKSSGRGAGTNFLIFCIVCCCCVLPILCILLTVFSPWILKLILGGSGTEGFVGGGDEGAIDDKEQ